MNAGHIIRGWAMRFGIIPTSDAEQKLSELRLTICDKCPFAEEKEVLKVINGNLSNAAEKVCTECHCPCLQASLVIDKKCPKNFW